MNIQHIRLALIILVTPFVTVLPVILCVLYPPFLAFVLTVLKVFVGIIVAIAAIMALISVARTALNLAFYVWDVDKETKFSWSEFKEWKELNDGDQIRY